ncbi:MAG: hypothetical protein AAGJ55_09515 [Cyanobacteria bacterium J06555_12]
MAIQFRPTVQADYPQICQLFPSPEEMYLIYPSGTFPMTTEQLQAIAQERIDLTSVAIDDRIVGFSNLYNYMPDQLRSLAMLSFIPSKEDRGWARHSLLTC